MREDGFFSFQTLLVTLFLSIIITGTGTAVYLVKNFANRVNRRVTEKSALQKEVMNIINQLSGDPTPDADSTFDPVWHYISNKSTENMKLQLTDLSSRININSVHPLFLERTQLRSTFKNGKTVETFRNIRNKNGFCINITATYRDIFNKSDLENYYTSYGYMNINTAYEFSLQRMFKLLTDDPAAAEVFHSFTAGALSSRRIMDADELLTAFRYNYHSIFPLIGTCPEMNVNFIPEFILKQVLTYPYGGKQLENSSAVLQRILYLRKAQEITSSQLRTIITIEEPLQERIFQYVGTKTWFWEIKITTKKNCAQAVAVYLPGNNYYRLYSFTVSHLP